MLSEVPVKKKRNIRLHESKVLSEIYAAMYNWQDLCSRLVEIMRNISGGKEIILCLSKACVFLNTCINSTRGDTSGCIVVRKKKKHAIHTVISGDMFNFVYQNRVIFVFH